MDAFPLGDDLPLSLLFRCDDGRLRELSGVTRVEAELDPLNGGALHVVYYVEWARGTALNLWLRDVRKCVGVRGGWVGRYGNDVWVFRPFRPGRRPRDAFRGRR
jgi:hypothetical protein